MKIRTPFGWNKFWPNACVTIKSSSCWTWPYTSSHDENEQKEGRPSSRKREWRKHLSWHKTPKTLTWLEKTHSNLSMAWKSGCNCKKWFVKGNPQIYSKTGIRKRPWRWQKLGMNPPTWQGYCFCPHFDTAPPWSIVWACIYSTGVQLITFQSKTLYDDKRGGA